MDLSEVTPPISGGIIDVTTPQTITFVANGKTGTATVYWEIRNIPAEEPEGINKDDFNCDCVAENMKECADARPYECYEHIANDTFRFEISIKFPDDFDHGQVVLDDDILMEYSQSADIGWLNCQLSGLADVIGKKSGNTGTELVFFAESNWAVDGEIVHKGEGLVIHDGAYANVETSVYIEEVNSKKMGKNITGIADKECCTGDMEICDPPVEKSLYNSRVDTRDNANDAIEIVDICINSISLMRASLGAYQNRFEHTANNLINSHANITTAESKIRDADIALKMVNLTKFNILQQAAQSMLSQASQTPQSVLELLAS